MRDSMDELMQWSIHHETHSLTQREKQHLQKSIPPLRGYHLMLCGANKTVDWLPENHLHAFSLAPLLSSSVSSSNIQSLFEELPLRDASIDAAIIPYVLEYCNDPQQFIAELFRVLIGEGKLFIFGFQRLHPWCWLNAPRAKNTLHYWRIKQLLQEAGFSINQAEWFHYGAIYYIEALKHVHAVTPLRPLWRAPVIEKHWQPTARITK